MSGMTTVLAGGAAPQAGTTPVIGAGSFTDEQVDKLREYGYSTRDIEDFKRTMNSAQMDAYLAENDAILAGMNSWLAPAPLAVAGGGAVITAAAMSGAKKHGFHRGATGLIGGAKTLGTAAGAAALIYGGSAIYDGVKAATGSWEAGNAAMIGAGALTAGGLIAGGHVLQGGPFNKTAIPSARALTGAGMKAAGLTFLAGGAFSAASQLTGVARNGLYDAGVGDATSWLVPGVAATTIGTAGAIAAGRRVPKGSIRSTLLAALIPTAMAGAGTTLVGGLTALNDLKEKPPGKVIGTSEV